MLFGVNPLIYNGLSAHKQQWQKGRHTVQRTQTQYKFRYTVGNKISIYIEVWSPWTVVDFVGFLSEKMYTQALQGTSLEHDRQTTAL